MQREKAYEAGSDQFWQKGTNLGTLVEKVENLLRAGWEIRMNEIQKNNRVGSRAAQPGRRAAASKDQSANQPAAPVNGAEQAGAERQEIFPSNPSLGEIGGQLRTRLERIAELCRVLLDDEQDVPAEITTKAKQICQTVENGLDYVKNRLDGSANGSPDQTSRAKHAHDFTNVVQFIGYAIDELSEIDAEHFARYRNSLQGIQEDYNGILADVRRWATGGTSPPPDGVSSAPTTVSKVSKALQATDGDVSRCSTRGVILVVDDDAQMRQELRSWLEQMGHAVEVAENGEAAIHAIGQRAVDMLLLDLHMDGKDGAAVLDEIKRDYSLRSMPVVILSAEADLTAVAQCIAKGADGFLPKPCNRMLLKAHVDACLLREQFRRNELSLNRQVHKAKRAADKILYKVFPYTIAEELRTGGRVQPRGYDNVAVMFCDIVGFTAYCQGRSAREVVHRLDELFSAFDDVIRKYKLEKIKTIGDCVMVTAGLLRRFANPVLRCLRCGDDLRKAAASVGPGWQVRIGIHAGPLMAGLVGRQMTFDVWGDTVNTSQRVETAAEPNGIAVSEAAWSQVFQRLPREIAGHSTA